MCYSSGFFFCDTNTRMTWVYVVQYLDLFMKLGVKLNECYPTGSSDPQVSFHVVAGWRMSASQ